MQRRSLLKLLGSAAAARALPRTMLAQTAQTAQPAQTDFSGGKQPAGKAFGNQLGFTPTRRKVVSVAMPADSAGSAGQAVTMFQVVELGSGKVRYEGTLGAARLDPHSGDRVAVADFSALETPGRYRLAVGGAEVGDTFAIGRHAYRGALRSAVRFYTGQRCGCAVDLGGGYRHGACHGKCGFDATSGRSDLQSGLRNTGGWHDAGDYGRYVVNSGISTGTLLWAWEMYPAGLHGLRLGIADGHRRIPDYLTEVRWNLQWMLSMQDADGGVWHKQTSREFCGAVMPEEDDRVSLVIGTGSVPYKSTGATADFAAVMAIAARCYQPVDRKFAAQCLTAARRAWSWAVTNPAVTFTNPPGISTGGYDDRDCADEILWATAELYRTTKEPAYELELLHLIGETLEQNALDASVPSWGSVASLGLWAYWFADGTNQHARDAIAAATASKAKELTERSRTSGYGHTLGETEYYWGSNAVVGNQGLLLLVADRMQATPEARAAALANLDYLLGRNCLGVSWVTQVGVRSPMHPHHRPSRADKLEEPWPGMLVAGPNHNGGDRVADALPKGPPMRMWVDDADAYSMNEVAINWNAPLVFLLAAAEGFEG